jgi:hypothetical protein
VSVDPKTIRTVAHGLYLAKPYGRIRNLPARQRQWEACVEYVMLQLKEEDPALNGTEFKRLCGR